MPGVFFVRVFFGRVFLVEVFFGRGGRSKGDKLGKLIA